MTSCEAMTLSWMAWAFALGLCVGALIVMRWPRRENRVPTNSRGPSN